MLGHWACRFHACPGRKQKRHEPAAVRSQDSAPTWYFLHVPKCAGTTTRLVLTNHFAASDILSAFDESFYYARQLPDHPEIHAPYVFASGHFGWKLPTLVEGRRWRIVTLLREPLERLLSLYDFLRQGDRLDSGLDFSTWIEHGLAPSDWMMAHLVRGMKRTATREIDRAAKRGIAAVQETLRPHLPAAIANLRSCEVVGLQERMDDTVNLMCAATGSLPPPHVPRANVTLHRTGRAQIDPRTLDLLDTHLLEERELYAAAQTLFDEQLSRLRQELAAETDQQLDSSGIRSALRRRFFARRSREIVEHGFGPEIHWSPADSFTGHNLHDREQHGEHKLRWTGPGRETCFYFPVNPDRRGEIELRLHPATPAAHAEGSRLVVNSQEVPLRCVATSGGYTLTGTFGPGQPPAECGLLSEFKLVSPTIRGANEFRELGVSLQSIHVRVQSPISPAAKLHLGLGVSTLTASSARSLTGDMSLVRHS